MLGTFISRCCELIIKSSLYIIVACLKFWNGSFRGLSDYVYDVKSLEQQLLIQRTIPGLNINLSLWISAASKVNTLLRKYFEKVWKWLFAEDVGLSLVDRFGGRTWLTVAGDCSCWLCDVWWSPRLCCDLGHFEAGSMPCPPRPHRSSLNPAKPQQCLTY